MTSIPIESKMMPVNAINMKRDLGDIGSLTAYFAEHGYPPPHDIVKLFPRITVAGQRALTASIRQNGFRKNESITVSDGKTADGIARCLSAIELGMPWKQVPRAKFEGDEPALLSFVIDKNVNRRHLDESQRAMVAARLWTMRQGARTDISQICGMSQPQAAELLNVGVRSVQHAASVLEQGVPELQDAVDRGLLAVSAANEATELPADRQREIVAASLVRPNPAKAFAAATRNVEIESRHRKILADARQHDLCGRRYVIIVVDYPWEGNVSYLGDPFPRLSIEQICEFRVDDGRYIRDVAAKDAIMFIWMPDKHIFALPAIAQAWGGSEPDFSMQWPKRTSGLGHYVRYQHETVWVCTRGNFAPPEEHLRPSSLIVGPRLDSGDGFHFALPHDGRHSSKPDRLYEIIEQAYPQYFGPETVASPNALELFARNYRPKWDGQGYEYPGRPDHDGGPKIPAGDVHGSRRAASADHTLPWSALEMVHRSRRSDAMDRGHKACAGLDPARVVEETPSRAAAWASWGRRQSKRLKRQPVKGEGVR
jgi:N6-adenosine-specific RNA methylase IME4